MIKPADERRIYFARCIAANGADMGAIKIGCSWHFRERAASISAQVPFRCEVLTTCPGEMFEESALHMWLKADHIRGEFFHDRGEVRRFVELVRQTDAMPITIEPNRPPWPWVKKPGVLNFMAVHGLSLSDATKVSGALLKSYEVMMNSTKGPSRRFVAALTVAALRKGHVVDWQSDFLTVAPTQEAAA